MQARTMRAVREMGQSYSAGEVGREREREKKIGPRAEVQAVHAPVDDAVLCFSLEAAGAQSSKTPMEAMLQCVACLQPRPCGPIADLFTVGIGAAGSCNCMFGPYRLYTASPHPNNHRRARQGLHA